MTIAFIFPGQGSQSIGMGKDLDANFSVAHEVFEEVNDALHFNLSQLMFEGDIQELTQTQNAQPAIMAKWGYPRNTRLVQDLQFSK